ncbi:MAG: hypothetical protein JO295_10180 [Verrucomicrobia bacterium]|nr:hypothetical protein [Verrucomicrobiota bacterium]
MRVTNSLFLDAVQAIAKQPHFSFCSCKAGRTLFATTATLASLLAIGGGSAVAEEQDHGPDVEIRVPADGQEPLPAKAPSRFNPDPGGGRNRGSAPASTDAPQTTLFGGAPLPQPPPYNSEPLPRNLALPRRNLRYPEELTLRLGYPNYQYGESNIGSLPGTVPQLNRWRIPFGVYPRYEDQRPEVPYQYALPRWFDPYKPSILKGDSPLFGQDIFLALTIQDQGVAEFRRIPVGSGASAARPGSFEFFGRSDSYTLSNDLSFTMELFKGETAFKPIDWAIRLTPVLNVNYSEFKETNILDPDPRGPHFDANGRAINNRLPQATGVIVNPADVGTFFSTGTSGLQSAPSDDFAGTRYTRRNEHFWSLQEAFAEIHIKDLSENYDFISTRIGSQLLNTDFRGFLFNDTNTGIRFFGNYANNRWQYNAAYFKQREKDTYSGLNELDGRDQDIFVVNLFRQDFLRYFLPESDERALGYTMLWSLVASQDHGDFHYDRNAVLVRPAPIGQIKQHDVDAYYFGWGGDGHIGKYNITNQFYQVFGRDRFNGIAGRPVDINAQFFALEVSQDHDWWRPKFSFLYASGDAHARDGTATGFDAILDNPTFAGAPFSFFTRQGFGLANTKVNTKQPNSLLLDLRTSKTEGQSNFVNPGTLLWGLGLDADLTPKLKFQANANYIRFVNTDAVRDVLFTDRVARDLGYDLSVGFTYRPLLTNNIIVNAGVGVLIPQHGYRDIYRRIAEPVPGFPTGEPGKVDPFLYSGIIAVTLTY